MSYGNPDRASRGAGKKTALVRVRNADSDNDNEIVLETLSPGNQSKLRGCRVNTALRLDQGSRVL